MKTLKPVFKNQTHTNVTSKWVIDNFPENYETYNYIEPFCGATNILINKNRSAVEILNDIDSDVVKIYQAIRDEPKEYLKRLKKYKFNKETFEKSLKKIKSDDYLDCAVSEYIARKMSKNGKKESFASTLKTELDQWTTSLSELQKLAERLQDVYIFNKDAIEIIQAFDSENTLIYCDPPYLHETNVSKKVYVSEISTDAHIALAHALNKSEAKILISGMVSPLYKRLYKDWNIAKATNPQQKKLKSKKEIIWKNF